VLISIIIKVNEKQCSVKHGIKHNTSCEKGLEYGAEHPNFNRRREKMSKDKTNLTECEQLVMKIIWESEEELTLPDIVKGVNDRFDKAWKPQTVSTFLARLVRKNFLTSYRSGRTFFYQPLVSAKDYGDKMIKHCVEFWGNDDAGEMLCALNDKRPLRSDEIEKIKELVNKL